MSLHQHYLPENTFVLIVYCMVDPIDEERRTIGDVGLLNAFLQILPQENVLHLSDSKSTKITTTIAREALQRLLVNIPERDGPCQVVIYYGGHGKEKGFCMEDGLCRHVDLIELLETYLRPGDSCWCLVDCCYSGNFCTFLQNRIVETGRELKASYCCVMSTTHDEEAEGEEWCLPGAFVAVMEGRVPLAYNDSNASSTHGNQGDSDWVPTMAQSMSFMADQHSIRTMDRMTAYICGPSLDPNDPFPFMIRNGDSTFSLGQRLASRVTPLLRGGGLTSNVGSHAPQLDPPHELQVGDSVCAKWRGGKPTKESIYLLPTWYNATVIAINDDDSVRVQFEYQTPQMSWESNVNMADLTDPLIFNYRYYNDTPSGIQVAQRRMAKCGKYVDYSIPVGTRVWGLWENDDVLYEGRVMSDRDLPWKKIGKHHFDKMYPGIVGPYVIVEWTEEGKWTIVPRCHLFVQRNPSDTVPTVTEMRNRSKKALEEESLLSHTPLECLRNSFRSAGKTLVRAEEVGNRLTCFWAEDSEWYGATPLTLNEDNSNVLVSHLRYQERGDYCLVRFTEDGVRACLPKKFVRAM